MTPVLAADAVCIGYRTARRRTTTIVRGIDAALQPGEFACLLGPNGVGKSTLLRTLIGAQPALGGSVSLDGRDLATMSARDRAQRLSVVLTDRIDVGLLTARSLVELGRAPRTGWFSRLGDDDRTVVEWALDAAGASALAERQVHELSDGERQRVMIARALAQQPDVLVLDEPTAFLDLTRRVELIALLRRLTDTTGLAVLMSTHELELALRTADAIWLVQPDGRFHTGAPEDLAVHGHVATAYAGGDISFDHDAGTFAVASATGDRPVVEVHGDRLGATWAARAAQRGGWTVALDTPDADATLDVRADDGVVAWELRLAGGPASSGTSFASLVDHLRPLATPRAPAHPTTSLEATP